MNVKNLILLLILCFSFIDCNEKSKLDNQLRVDGLELEGMVNKGYEKVPKEIFFYDKIIIGEIDNLKKMKSINIVGYQFYSLDSLGNIVSIYNSTNNFSEYAYDQNSRLIRVEYKLHNPPKMHRSIDYEYFDSTMRKTMTIYKGVEVEKKSDILFLDDDVIKNYFGHNKIGNLYINKNRNKIISYESEMIFCCGTIMKGLNKLVYYLNKEELIDSLTIINAETQKKIRFDYQYEIAD